MRQFILASGATKLNAGANLTTIAPNNLYVLPVKGADDKEQFLQFIWKNRENGAVSNMIVDKAHLSYTKTTPRAGVKASVTYTMPAPVERVDYVISLYRKGAVFNERNVFNTSSHKSSLVDTAAKLAADLAKNVNFLTELAGVTATVNGADLTLTSVDANSPVKIEVFTHSSEDGRKDLTAKNTIVGVLPIFDNALTKELAHKCIGDRGINYTDVCGSDLYTDIADLITAQLYQVYTIRCYSPRYDHNIDEPLYHKIYIAVPSDKAAAVDTVISKALADNEE